MTTQTRTLVRWFQELGSDDTKSVGGKNASLGEMLSELAEKGVRVPDGFATTADAYRQFLDHNELRDRIREQIDQFHDGAELQEVGEQIRGFIRAAEFPEELTREIREAYRQLAQQVEEEQLSVAIRSSATAEDLPEASFAGQQETYLNVRGEDDVLQRCKDCFASLFTDRAIAYREENGFDHLKVALSAGVQQMVAADCGAAGVMFSIHTESGFPDVVVIDAAWGLGETVVGGEVNPDEYLVFKPLLGESEQNGIVPILSKQCGSKEKKAIYAEEGRGELDTVDTSEEERHAFVLSDDDILQLAHWAVAIEEHYGRPMDMEWARDGQTGELFILQARPETVQSRKEAGSLKAYELKERSEKLVEGLAIGNAIAAGTVRVLKSPDEGDRFNDGDVLVTTMTDPDWGPLMERAAAIVTDEGGRTAHAAIVSRELSIPALVGTEDATDKLKDGDDVTVSCAEGDRGNVYDGQLDFDTRELDLENVPQTRTRIMMNIASPGAAFRWHKLPCHGIGLARMEFIIGNIIKVHPMALVRLDELEDQEARKAIEALTVGYDDKTAYFVEHLAHGIARIAASQHPEPVIVRLSDFKTNEYAGLIGGAEIEPEENNPMLGFRGASRYYSDRYRDGFKLECRALRRAREQIGMRNVVVMVPFCRTVAEADRVLEVMAEEGLERGRNDLQVYVMAEIPANVWLAEQFAERFDGFSIGSNDLTQLVLGVDRDSEDLAHLFDEQNEAVKRAIRALIEVAHEHGAKVGICGQAPSDHPEFAEFLVKAGIDSISLNPDSVLEALEHVAQTEAS
jgi:pyruvate,water dikinase